MANILIKEVLILPMDRKADEELYFKGSVGIKGKKIAMVAIKSAGDYSQRVSDFETTTEDLTVIDGSNFVVMPGLINTHTHVAMTLMRGYADDMPLMEWLETKVWPFEGKLSREDILAGTRLGICEMLLGGTTTFVDMYYHQEAVAEAVESSGIRAVLSPFFTDFNMDTFKIDFENVISRYANGQCSRIDIIISPHAPYTCSVEHLQYAKELSEKYNLAIHIHLSETANEVNIIKEKYGKSPVEFIDSMGLLGPRTLAAHCVHLSDNDIQILKERGVSVAHNPQSNMKLASGICPVSKLLSQGVNVSLGTDGVCSNNDLDMWEELRTASLLQKVSTLDPCAMNAYESLRLATVNGAQAISRDDLGVLSEGKTADMIMLDLNQAHLTPAHNIVANLAYAAKSSDVRTVIVDGELVVEDGKLLKINVEDQMQDIAHRIQNLV